MPKCEICKAKFIRNRPLDTWCSIDCGVKVAQKRLSKKKKREIQDKRLKLKPRKYWLKKAESAVNTYIRLRDHNQPCISCGRFHDGQYHAGHYRTVKACPELRFNELNIHKQCSVCNNHLSGNLTAYRKALCKKIGLDQVELLEGPHPPLKLSIDDIKAIIAEYKAKAKALKKSLDKEE